MAHAAGHADERIHTSKAHTNAPEPRTLHNAFTNGDITRLKR